MEPQGRFAVIDVETTGLSPDRDRVLELAVVTADTNGRVLGEWSSRFNPGGPVGATHIHGITQSDVEHLPGFERRIDEILPLLRGAAVCAHNARFDLAFLRAEFGRAGWAMPFVPALCTLEASQHHLPHLDRRRLADCCEAVGLPLHRAHSALGDAHAAAGLLAAFLDPRRGSAPRAEELAVAHRAREVGWPTRAQSDPISTARFAASRRPRPTERARTVMSAPQVPSPTLVSLIRQFSLIDAVDEGATKGSVSYLEKLAEVLEDGVIDESEADELDELSRVQGLSASDVIAANLAFTRALAHAALDDGKVTRDERAEIQRIATALNVDDRVVPRLLEAATHARSARLSAGLAPLPADWSYGEPLRVGDKVVFTGCDPVERRALETRSERLGVRVINSVSAKTRLLVTDGYDGGKSAKAAQLGTRTVSPEAYAVLLAHLQPAAPPMVSKPGATGDRPAANAIAPAEGTPPSPTLPAPPATIRAWGRANGWALGDRGRLPGPLVRAYSEAMHSGSDD